MNQRADVVGENLCALLFCMIVITSCRPFICGVSVCCMLQYISLFTPQSLEQISAKKLNTIKMDRKDRHRPLSTLIPEIGSYAAWSSPR
ncbi:hypothetical protein P8452_28177 [Trifolium repens]|nr:hypothetical protein P8452_28177 [Trifolium repens]